MTGSLRSDLSSREKAQTLPADGFQHPVLSAAV